VLGRNHGEIVPKAPVITGALGPARAAPAWIVGGTLGAIFVLAVGLWRRRMVRRAPDEV